MEFRTAHTSGR